MTRWAAIFIGLVAAGDAFVVTNAPSIASRGGNRPVCLRGWCSTPFPFRARSRAPASRVKIKQMSDGVEDFCVTELNVMTANLSRQVMRRGDGGAGHSEERRPANDVFQSRKKHVAQRDEWVLVPLCHTCLSAQFLCRLRLPVPPL